MSRELVEVLRAALRALSGSPARVLVLAANGPGFCAGADLKERKVDDRRRRSIAHNRAINALANELAAVAAPARSPRSAASRIGGGLELALACDLRFAASDATIGLTEARIGAMPGAGGTQRLPRLIGTARALEMMYSAASRSRGQGRWLGPRERRGRRPMG